MRRAIVLAVLLAASPARADDACAKLDHEDLAACREDHDQLASAWTAWRAVKAQARADGDAKRAASATEHITAIEPRLAHLTLALPRGTDAPDGLTVTLDGAPVALDDLGSASAIDQGDHHLAADAPGFAAWSQDLFVENGAFKTVTIELAVADDEAPLEPGEPNLQPPPGAPVAPAPAPPSRVQKYVGLTALGAGVVMLGVGGWAGLDARSQRDDARALGCNDDLSSCPRGAAFDAADASYRRGILSTGLVVGGAVVAAVGAILWLTAPSGVSADLGPDHAGLAYMTAF